MDTALRAMSDAVLTIAAERRVDPVLRKLADAARDLADARYAAIGIPDGEGGFATFLTSGMSDAQYEALGRLPRTHGMLGAMLLAPEPFRTANIQDDPRFEGWPSAHPSMRSFLGVPIVSRGEVIGAFYLTEKKGERGAVFTDEDEELIGTLAAHAAIAIENARLNERSRELSTIEERKRLARELHDSVTQTLFSIGLTAEAASELVEADPDKARAQLGRLQELTRAAMQEMRSLIFELRPAELEAEGLAAALRKHVEVLTRLHPQEIDLRADGERRLPPDVERGLLRIAQEALGNALRHSGAAHVAIELAARDGRVSLSVADDGSGFDPEEAATRSRRLGLTSMRERAEALGGSLSIRSVPGTGTTVTVEVEA
ncbi:MAG TPA: GAF domain-containing sensor histidine kinase [Gaiellaceae bacterium]|nr:GAF domain-containing sensor histidine kinase [Gaiellaceae bacterium]